MKTTHGEVIYLVWPDGNDDGELFVRGHFNDSEAREILLRESEQLETIAFISLEDDDNPGSMDSDAIGDRCENLIEKARIERIYARWSQESGFDEGTTALRTYRNPGHGRFAVTRATLFPRTPCALSTRQGSGVYDCRECGRRFRGPFDPHNLTGPADCEWLAGDEQVRAFTDVYEELEPATNQSATA